jgi:hypothetical protein
LKESRVAVLLGAGASADAGLPMTGQLTKDLIDLMGQSQNYESRRLAETLNFVCSAMIGHRGNTGGNPYSALNVERMFSALRLLKTRSDHEASPFVTAWLPSVEAFDDHPVPSSGSSVVGEIARALSGTGSGDGVAKAVAEISRAAMQPGSGAIYERLERELKAAVCILLASHGDVSYLRPLASLAEAQGVLDVATLNYDLTVEAMCQQVGVEFDTGIVDWEPGKPLGFEPGSGPKLNLVKLHGSIDWSYQPRIPGNGDENRFIRTSVVTTSEPADNRVPAIVIGDREKLTADGPTLALMRSFQESLEKAHRLVIVGYSFADDHINGVIRDWINADGSRTLTVLDPAWPRQPKGFQKDLVDGLLSTFFRGPVGPPRMKVIRNTAKEKLLEALQQGPTSDPLNRFEAKFLRDSDGTPLILVSNLGEDVEGLIIRTERIQPEGCVDILRGFAQPRSGADTAPWHNLGDLAGDSHLDVEPRFIEQKNGRTAISLQYLTSTRQEVTRLEVDVMAD